MHDLRPPPPPALRALVAQLWSHDPGPAAARHEGAREHVLPTGATHLVFRLGGPPLRLFEGGGGGTSQGQEVGHAVGHAVVGGARAAYYVRDVSQPAASVGALLRPGAAQVLLGAPESALAGHHTPLESLIGEAETARMLALLQAADSPGRRLACFAQWLLQRAAGRGPMRHPAITAALPHLSHLFHLGEGHLSVQQLVAASGLSHRHFIAQFRLVTGLTPRAMLRLQRFGRALDLAAEGTLGWAEVAAAAGYADQSHLVNAFGQIAGVTPQAWRRGIDRAAPRHVAR